MKDLWLYLVLLMASSVFGAEPKCPLLPADTSSPRATLSSFVEISTAAYELLKAEGRGPENQDVIEESRGQLKIDSSQHGSAVRTA